MTPPFLRPVEAADIPALLDLNNGAVPHVGPLDAARLAALLAWAWWAVTTPERHAFMVVLPPGTAYASRNYRWIDARWRRFVYVDRIAVAPDARGTGIGRRMYEVLAERAAAHGIPRVTCEVNVNPPNPGSIAFHERMGFRRTGIRADPDGAGAVAIMRRTLG